MSNENVLKSNAFRGEPTQQDSKDNLLSDALSKALKNLSMKEKRENDKIQLQIKENINIDNIIKLVPLIEMQAQTQHSQHSQYPLSSQHPHNSQNSQNSQHVQQSQIHHQSAPAQSHISQLSLQLQQSQNLHNANDKLINNNTSPDKQMDNIKMLDSILSNENSNMQTLNKGKYSTFKEQDQFSFGDESTTPTSGNSTLENSYQKSSSIHIKIPDQKQEFFSSPNQGTDHLNHLSLPNEFKEGSPSSFSPSSFPGNGIHGMPQITSRRVHRIQRREALKIKKSTLGLDNLRIPVSTSSAFEM